METREWMKWSFGLTALLAMALLLTLLPRSPMRVGEDLDAPGDQRHPNVFALAPDGKKLASLCSDGKVRLWESASGKELRLFNDSAGSLRALAFSPNGKELIGLGKALTVWDVTTGSELRRFPIAVSGKDFFAFSPDGKILATGDGRPLTRGSGAQVARDNVRWWSLTNGEQLGRPVCAQP